MWTRRETAPEEDIRNRQKNPDYEPICARHWTLKKIEEEAGDTEGDAHKSHNSERVLPKKQRAWVEKVTS